MSDNNDQIFELWAAGKLDEGGAVSTGEKWDVFYVLDQATTGLVDSVDARSEAARKRASDAESFTELIAGVVAGSAPCWAWSSPSSSRTASCAACRTCGAGSSAWPEVTCRSASLSAAGTSWARWRAR